MRGGIGVTLGHIICRPVWRDGHHPYLVAEIAKECAQIEVYETIVMEQLRNV